jgi:hypothetical protein
MNYEVKIKMKRTTDPVTRRYVSADKHFPNRIHACFTEFESSLIASYAQNYGLTTSDFVRQAMMEKISKIPILGGR